LWRKSAACRGFSELMFDPRKVEAAKAICAGCPVVERCRLEAIDTMSTFGVWGGLTEQERDHIPEQIHNGIMIVIEHENGRLIGATPVGGPE
jgi:WhiB family transcriptional regulator, redox-sensing transcriptional regulator